MRTPASAVSSSAISGWPFKDSATSVHGRRSSGHSRLSHRGVSDRYGGVHRDTGLPVSELVDIAKREAR